MIDDVVLGLILFAVVLGLWFTRRARGPAFGEGRQRVWDAESRSGPSGEPTGFDKTDDFPPT
ncbi:MAG TPA: hypothetical protein VH025_01535 [Solirubrobacteraceae bacterium]|nr:hypothetical protein [Solirubrobacteraceae bacterium]